LVAVEDHLFGCVVGASAAINGGIGGLSFLGSSSNSVGTTSGSTQGNGNAGKNYGGGGGGAISITGGTTATGGAGAGGIIIITEFVAS